MAAARPRGRPWVRLTVLWGLACAASVGAFVEWQARRNCIKTLAMLKQRTSTGVSELALSDAKTLVSGRPQEWSGGSPDAKSVIYSWQGIFRSHHVRVGLKDTDNVATVSTMSLSEFTDLVARSAKSTHPREGQPKRSSPSSAVAKASGDGSPKDESQPRQLAVLGNGEVAPPTSAELEAHPDVMRSFQERFASGARSSLPASADVYVDRQFVDDQEQWYRDTYLTAFDRFGTKDAAWNDEATRFIGVAIRAVIERRLRESKVQANVPVDPDLDLTQQIQQVLDTGCRDPLVLSLCAQLLTDPQSREAARQHALAAVELFEQSDYPLEVAATATLQAAILARSLADRQAWNARAETQMLDLLRNRQYQPIERRILLARFQPVLDGFLGQQPARFAKELANSQITDDWLKSMLLGRFQLRLASDALFFWFATGIQEFAPDSPEMQTMFEQFARAAAVHFMQAWHLDAQLPEAAVDMLRLYELHSSVVMGSPRFWFDQAVQSHFDHPPAYGTMRRALSASAAFDELLELGRECLATGRFDTTVPDEFQRAAARVLQREQRRSLEWYRELHKDYQRWYDGYLAERV